MHRASRKRPGACSCRCLRVPIQSFDHATEIEPPAAHRRKLQRLRHRTRQRAARRDRRPGHRQARRPRTHRHHPGQLRQGHPRSLTPAVPRPAARAPGRDKHSSFGRRSPDATVVVPQEFPALQRHRLRRPGRMCPIIAPPQWLTHRNRNRIDANWNIGRPGGGSDANDQPGSTALGGGASGLLLSRSTALRQRRPARPDGGNHRGSRPR